MEVGRHPLCYLMFRISHGSTKACAIDGAATGQVLRCSEGRNNTHTHTHTAPHRVAPCEDTSCTSRLADRSAFALLLALLLCCLLACLQVLLPIHSTTHHSRLVLRLCWSRVDGKVGAMSWTTSARRKVHSACSLASQSNTLQRAFEHVGIRSMRFLHVVQGPAAHTSID